MSRGTWRQHLHHRRHRLQAADDLACELARWDGLKVLGVRFVRSELPRLGPPPRCPAGDRAARCSGVRPGDQELKRRTAALIAAAGYGPDDPLVVGVQRRRTAGVRTVGIREHAGRRLCRHGGSWAGLNAQLTRLAGQGSSVVVLATDNDEDRTVALAQGLIEKLATS